MSIRAILYHDVFVAVYVFVVSSGGLLFSDTCDGNDTCFALFCIHDDATQMIRNFYSHDISTIGTYMDIGQGQYSSISDGVNIHKQSIFLDGSKK